MLIHLRTKHAVLLWDVRSTLTLFMIIFVGRLNKKLTIVQLVWNNMAAIDDVVYYKG